MQLDKTNIILGITGGIAAYKTPDLVRKLVAKGANVRVVMTDSAKEFVSPLALQAVSGNSVSDNLLDKDAEAAMGHIELARWADKLLIAPATANFMAKLTHGLADDLLSTLCLATTAPIYVAPAMNQQMWNADATQANLNSLELRKVQFLGPAQGEQACGDVGPGRMLEPQEIADLLWQQTPEKTLTGKRITITAGPTREEIDPVRYLSNHSSGKMGYALAIAAQELGATVTLISGPVNLLPPANIQTIPVSSAQQMHDAVMHTTHNCDIFIGCAAVADYRVQHKSNQKIKKSNSELTLTFVKNPDILSDVAHLTNAPFTLGFAAETQNLREYALGKLQRKKLNMIAANDVSDSTIGFNNEQNALTVFWSKGEKKLDVADKHLLAMQLMHLVTQRYIEDSND
ncbi:bifunctional phosphopantothenoylcysteine decarboxylase/phosphopantothenate--cysteine ligase CoaBC [Paraglaciecola sp.]|nr:bifunctional phosphopantothenoylcysteine decarboxylase/phosphopantothenate--cysteine ligase CoaBC [Paraglaciecola sp.]MDB4281552.1 bifunctional phosphopantothenoylcysteine decarboxylase/phosphopantothenate--cysteine ligase CoaBC [Paraglaciecola sp.]MDB4281571.1 bifunctional phosphopantothenoylcysteine decarboxylase/phosphopantothenate--cysteine ligase CoaBC [Paraglaciecola sp.]MDB4327025.1 bifunctional phosphopantothenoylcysteine decarboxylase/phosphopantothenate--cysteine ligase CoaBC [bacte